MEYKTIKIMFDLHWRKNGDLKENIENLLSKDFTIHKKSGAKGFFEIESDPLRYRQLKRALLEKLSRPGVAISDIHESLWYARLNMELRQLENRPISDEMFHKTFYIIAKIEKQMPELKQVGIDLACAYWNEASIANQEYYQQMLSPKM